MGTLALPHARDPLPPQPLPRRRGRGARGRGPRCGCCASAWARTSSCWSATARRSGAPRAAVALLRGGLRPGRRRRRGAPHRRARRPRPQRAPRVRLARAGGRARGGRARRAAPAQLPPRLRGRDVLQRRGEDCTRCHGRDTRPGVRLNCRGSRAEARSSTPRRSRAGSGRLGASADAFVVPSAFALARLQALGAPLGGRACTWSRTSVRAFAERLARGRRAARARRRRGSRPTRASTSRSRACAARGPPARRGGRRPATRASCGARRVPAPTCASPGRVPRGRARAAARGRRARDRALALRRDVRPGGRRGDGGGPAGRRVARRRAAPTSCPTPTSRAWATRTRWPGVARRLWGDAAVGERNADFIGDARGAGRGRAGARAGLRRPRLTPGAGYRPPGAARDRPSVRSGARPRTLPRHACTRDRRRRLHRLEPRRRPRRPRRRRDRHRRPLLRQAREPRPARSPRREARRGRHPRRGRRARRVRRRRPELVFHLAAQIDVRKSVDDPALDAASTSSARSTCSRPRASTACRR